MAQEIITPSRELNQVQGPSEIRTLLCGLHPHETSPAFQIVSFTLSLAVGLKKKKSFLWSHLIFSKSKVHAQSVQLNQVKK